MVEHRDFLLVLKWVLIDIVWVPKVVIYVHLIWAFTSIGHEQNI